MTNPWERGPERELSRKLHVLIAAVAGAWMMVRAAENSVAAVPELGK
jgi:hypothetical protein